MSKRMFLLVVLGISICAPLILRPTSMADQKTSLGKSLERAATEPEGAAQPIPRRSTAKSVEAAASTPAPQAAVSNQNQIIPNCLMITDVRVVNSPQATNGPWSFGYLMRSAANHDASGIKPEQLVRNWLAHWETDQVPNGQTVRKRDGIAEFITNWPKKPDGDLDLDRAPFRLLAIVNRVDLRNNLVLGVSRIGGGGAGEGRFVFGGVDPGGEPLNFTVIFEYGIKLRTFEEVQAWGRQWYALKDLTIGSTEYLNRLQEITEQFAAPAVDPEQPPSGSALVQLRTNENAFGNVWELREFRLDLHHTGLLRQVTVKQTPNLTWQGSADLLAFVRDKESEILGNRHAVPVASPTGTPMQAGSALMQRFFKWRLPDDAPPNLEGALRKLAFNTCNGCHLAETDTEFTHVSPRALGDKAHLSRFLEEVDLPAREADLRQLIETGRPYEMKRLPLQFVH